MNKGNAKSYNSKQRLFEALIYLIENDDYSLITVSQIASHAEVSRVTFYRNFKTKEDVIKFKIQEIIDDYLQEHNQLSNLSLHSIAHLLFSLIVDNLHFFRLLNKNNLIYLFTEPIYRRIIDEHAAKRAELWSKYNEITFKNILSLTFGSFEGFIKNRIDDPHPTTDQWLKEYIQALNVIREMDFQS